MPENCAIIPIVRNNKGQKVESRLFKSLLTFTSNRNDAVNIYLTTKNQDFINDQYPRLTLDDNNEPTLKSLIDKVDLGNYISDTRILEQLNRDIGHYKQGSNDERLWDNTYNNVQKLTEDIIDFNNNSQFKDDYVAVLTKNYDPKSSNIKLGIKVEKRTSTNSQSAKQLEYNYNLNKRLRSILESHGISVGVLTALEQRLGINGVTDFSIAKNASEGIIELIRIAQGIEGEEALPEEFAHFAIEALVDNPLVKRLVNQLHSDGLVREILGESYLDYKLQYKGDEAKLAREAAGKLLAKHLLDKQEIPAKPYRNLLQRVIEAVKRFFRGINASSIQKAIVQANSDASIVAQQILSGHLDNTINTQNIGVRDSLFNLSDRVSRDKKLLQRLINTELKRYKIYQKRNPNSKFETQQKLFINKLQLFLSDGNEIEGIYSFMEEALSKMKLVNDRLVSLQQDQYKSVNEKARILRDIRSYIYSYEGVTEDILAAILDERKFQDNRYEEKMRAALDQMNSLIKELHLQYNQEAMPLFVNFVKQFIGDGITVPYGKYKGKTYTAEELIKKADRDISFFDRWLDSMADSSDYMIKILDQAVKRSKNKARLETIDIIKQLQYETSKLEEAGIKDTNWMFERDEDGNLTGNYISEIDTALYNKALKEFRDKMSKKYGVFPVGDDAIRYQEELNEWYNRNTQIVNGRRVPNKSIYTSQVFNNLSQIQKDYYRKVMDIKAKLDSYLPNNYTTLLNTIKIRKDLLERVKSSNAKQGLSQIIESVKDKFIRRTDDTMFGDRAVLKDFEGRQVQILPIYYTKLNEGESENDISTDIVSTLGAYASMALDFKEMNSVIHILELGRDLLRQRTVPQTQGGKALKEIFTVFGNKVESPLTESGDKTNFMQRLNDAFEMQVYGRYIADEGTFGKTKIDKAKVADQINELTALNTLALNLISGISNITTGKVMMRIESFAGQFFTESDTLKADRIYAQEMPKFLSQIGNRIKTSKLALWNELFNVLQEYEKQVRELNYDRKTWFSRMFGTKSLFFINNAGEHWMQTRTSLALANTYKMKSPTGEIVSLWDAMEVVPIDKNNPNKGATLQVKKGYTKADGTEFTEKDIFEFTRKSAAINERMHGIYNYEDRNAVQRIAIGRLGMLYRKWMRPAYNRRFRDLTFNFDLQEWEEGYYRTMGRFLWNTVKELKEAKFSLIANFKQLDEREKQNIIRAATEIGHFLIIAAILGFVDWPDDEDSWVLNMLELQCRRLYTELGVMVPGPQMASEGLRIVKQPAAGVSTIDGILGLTGILNPFNWETIAGEDAVVQSGRYKGESKAMKLIYEAPPMNKTIYRVTNPEEVIPFYKQ